MLARILKIAGATILIIAVIWALVLGWWQANDYQPSRFEMLLYLGALPLSLIGGYWLLHGFIEHLKNPPAPPVATEGNLADNDPLNSASAKTAAAERGYSINLIGSSVASSAGMSASEILDAISAKRRPKLDESLKDDDGFPVFTARVSDLDINEFIEKPAFQDAGFPSPLKTDEFLRALALLDVALSPVLTQVSELLEQTLPKARLRLLWLIPADWDQSHVPVLQAWLRAEHLASIDKGRLEISIRQTATDSDTLQEIDELILATRREQLENDLHLVIGTHSNIGDDAIQAWSSRKILFTAANQSGQIPGEGAACLLFTAAQPETPNAFENPVRVSRVSRAQRDKPVDGGGRINGALIEQLIEGLMTIRGIDASAIRKVVSDGDHRETRVAELMNAIAELLKDLDPMESCLQIGTACGSTPPFGSLLALACAREKAIADDGAVLCVSNQHATARAVLLVEPLPPPLADAESVAL
jgi:hypothetical protein